MVLIYIHIFKITNMAQIILETLESLIRIGLTSVNEIEYFAKHAVMKQSAVKSIFEHFLSDHSVDSSIANHCYQILTGVSH